MFWYFPIEPYEERYSIYLSGEDGFWETFLKQNQIAYRTLRPSHMPQQSGRIRIGKGFVLDTYRRCEWAMEQVRMFLAALDNGAVKDGDVLYLEDFWHPGFEALPYARSMYGVKFKIYAWCHAQSVDPSDFTSLMGMAPWMRYFEQGIAKSLDGIFVADYGLKEMLLSPPQHYYSMRRLPYSPLPVDKCPIYAVATCWNTDQIRKRYGWEQRPPFQRKPFVVFASRWDKEKNPQLFCALAERMWKEIPGIRFVVTTGFAELTSNDPALVTLAHDTAKALPNNFEIRTNVSKQDYFRFLNTEAKVHFNCVWHDWVSYALLESASMGCLPLFPDYKAFPLALQYDQRYLYERGNLNDAAAKLKDLLSDSHAHDSMDWMLNRFDNSIPYVARIMGIYGGPQGTRP